MNSISAECIKMEKSETLKKDIELCDQFIDISETAKRIVRVSTKTYETSGTYVAIRLFSRNNQSDDDYKFSQRVNLSRSEFDRLVEHFHRIRDLIDSKDTEVPLRGENDRFSQPTIRIWKTRVNPYRKSRKI